MRKILVIATSTAALAITAAGCGSAAANPAMARAVDHCYNLNPQAGRSACECAVTKAQARGYDLRKLAAVTKDGYLADDKLMQIAFSCIG